VAHTGYDFDLSDIVTGEGSQQKPSILRALNVFRDYGLQDTCRGMRKLCAQLATDGGILVEGSASPNGDVWCVLLANHKCEIVRVLFGTSLPLLDERCWPEEFRKCLPRLWRNYVQTNHHHHHPWWIQPIARLLDEEWKHTVCSFADSLKDVPKINPAWMEHGILVWQPPHPIQIPRAEETNLKHTFQCTNSDNPQEKGQQQQDEYCLDDDHNDDGTHLFALGNEINELDRNGIESDFRIH